MRYGTLAVGALFLAASALFTPAPAADEAVTAQLQQIVDDYQAQNAATEGFTGIELQVSLGDAGPVIAVSSGNDGLRNAQPMTTGALFQIGSNTKSFTAALILKLEAAGKLKIDQTIGDWLPEYPAWKSVTIRSLLNMTSGIPTYDETEDIGAKQLDLNYQFTPQELITAVDPDEGSNIPPTTGYSYSNTNYILAGLIIERASGMSYKEALEKLIFEPLHLTNTYYFNGPTPRSIVRRMPAGFYNDPTCLDYQPGAPCSGPESTLYPLIGTDTRAENMSWAGPAGSIIATLGDLAQWWRAVFELRVFPQAQLDEMEMLISAVTTNQIPLGHPIPGSTSAENPFGFGLGVAQLYNASLQGYIWYYQGEGLACRVIFAYWPQYNLVVTAAVNSTVSALVGPNFTNGVLPATLAALLSAGVIDNSGAATASQ